MARNDLITIQKLKAMSDDRKATSSVSGNVLPSKTKLTRVGCLDRLSHIFMYCFEPLLPGDGTKTDGRIASLVYLICLTTAGIAMNATSWLQADASVTGVTTDHIDGFLMTCICPALLWIVFIFLKQNDRKTVDFITPLPHSHRPLMAGAYVFGAGSCVMDLMHIAYYVQCSFNVSSVAFSVFKVLFILAQILFLRKFANATLHKSQNIRLVLFHILGTNICIWFRALFSHSSLIFNKDAILTDQGDRNGSAFDSSLFCDSVDSPMMRVWEASEPYLYPFTMEYSLIAGGILYTMWSGMRDLDQDPQDIYIYDELADYQATEGATTEASDYNDDSSGYLGSQPSFGAWSRSQSHMSLHRSVSTVSLCKSCHDNHGQLMQRYNPSSDPGFLFGLLVSTILLLTIALLWIDQTSYNALRIYFVCQIILHTTMCICLWVVLKALLSQQSAWFPYDSDDTLLMVSFTGVFLYAGLSFTASLAENKLIEQLPIYTGVKSMLVMLESMLQLTAIIKALRFKPCSSRKHSDLVRQGALFLLTTNFALWAQDSFFELRTSATTPVQNLMFGDHTWRGITVLSYPLCIFFRFHSGACLFEIWSSFKLD